MGEGAAGDKETMRGGGGGGIDASNGRGAWENGRGGRGGGDPLARSAGTSNGDGDMAVETMDSDVAMDAIGDGGAGDIGEGEGASPVK